MLVFAPKMKKRSSTGPEWEVLHGDEGASRDPEEPSLVVGSREALSRILTGSNFDYKPLQPNQTKSIFVSVELDAEVRLNEHLQHVKSTYPTDRTRRNTFSRLQPRVCLQRTKLKECTPTGSLVDSQCHLVAVVEKVASLDLNKGVKELKNKLQKNRWCRSFGPTRLSGSCFCRPKHPILGGI
ncbi:Hypothetical predicted protein [Xyrichtys novacula]|uniref:Uncharacterized protein n=1 Tax=Xyrichtys novacula TaxID=13765 RepID=A0AAV1HIX8_XYRNO|nr:Hypothetical predicted protein [Xyrichtys novacula]